MQLRKLFEMDDERAVSPVIGVILMVAITVILAAVIGTFVLGLGDQVQETSPSTQWSWSTSSDDVTLVHDGGDSVNAEQLSIVGGPVETATAGGPHEDLSGPDPGFDEERISAGDSMTLVSGDHIDAGETGEIRLIWTSDGGGQSSTLSRYNYDPN